MDDLVDDIVYCDYSNPEFSCKPEPEFYIDVREFVTLISLSSLWRFQAMEKAGISEPAKCYFVDDSHMNVKAARKLGWGHCVHFCERGLVHMEGGKAKEIGSDIQISPEEEGIVTITKLEELRTAWPELFKQT